MRSTLPPVTDSISLFFPMLNEADNIEPVVESALGVLAGVTSTSEVIVVDDGSTDGTGEIADRLAASDARVRVVHHERNRGYGAALRSGFGASRYALVGFVDGDSQFDIGELPILLNVIREFDLVSGYRIKRRDPFQRRVNAQIYNLAVRMLFDIPIRDVNCGFKLYRGDFVRRLLPELHTTGALINVEMLARARRAGARVAEVGVRHYPRVAGSQTGGSPAVIGRAFRELFALARELR